MIRKILISPDICPRTVGIGVMSDGFKIGPVSSCCQDFLVKWSTWRCSNCGNHITPIPIFVGPALAEFPIPFSSNMKMHGYIAQWTGLGVADFEISICWPA